MSIRSAAAAAFASELAKLIGLLLVAGGIFAGIMWYLGRDERQAARDSVKEKEFQDTTTALRKDSARLDTVKTHADAGYIATIQALQAEVARIRRARASGDTLVAKKDFDTVVKACTETLPAACEKKVAARDSIIHNRDARIKALEQRPPMYRAPPRFNLTAALLADVDSVAPVGRLDADLRLRGHFGLVGSVEATQHGTRKRVGVRWQF